MSCLKEIPSFIPAKDKNPIGKKKYGNIPKKIFQTWETNKLTFGMYDAVYTWINKNPDWEYYFFDKDNRRNFIRDNFSKKILAAYDNLNPGSYKADLFRFCVLYTHGGIYNDIKQELLVSLNDVLPSDVEFLSIKDKDHKSNEFLGYIYCSFICSKPKHPFLKKAIDLLVEYTEKGWYGSNSISCAGPGILGRSVNLCLGRAENSQILPGVHNISGISFELWPVPNFDIEITTTDKNIAFLNNHYKNYRKELYSNISDNLNKHYDLCWYFNKVYKHGRVVRPKLTVKGRILYGLRKIKRYLKYLKLKINY